MAPTLTLFFIVEPPSYQHMACYLAASIRQHLPGDVRLVGYCPAQGMDALDPNAVEALRRMRCDVRPMETEGRFDPAYPHGNKILACLQERDTDFSGFVDSDVLMIRDNRIDALVRDGHVSCSAAASIHWAPDDLWEVIYGAFGMEVPEDRIRLMRDRRRPMVPYYSSGFVLFPEGPTAPGGRSFPEIWMDTAQKIDRIDGLDNTRPYLDQMSLPVAIRRAGLGWHELPEEQHFILGGKLRGKPFPKTREIFTVHYRKWEVLDEADLATHGYEALQKAVGVKRLRRIHDAPLPDGIAPADPPPA